MVVAGTAINDTFYIFNDNDGRQYLFGAGIKLENIDGIERLALVTGAGNDTVYLYGLNEELSLLINMGSGDDRLLLGGEEQKFDVTYPASSAIHTVEHGQLRDKLVGSELRYNDVYFQKRSLELPDKQTAFNAFYQKWVNPEANVTLSSKHWDLLETNLTLAMKLFAQAVERSRRGTRPRALAGKRLVALRMELLRCLLRPFELPGWRRSVRARIAYNA